MGVLEGVVWTQINFLGPYIDSSERLNNIEVSNLLR